MWFFFFFQAEDGIRDAQESRGLGDVYKRQVSTQSTGRFWSAMEPLTTLPAVREYIKQQLIQLLDLDPDDDDEFPDDDENLNSWDLDSKKAEALRQRSQEHILVRTDAAYQADRGHQSGYQRRRVAQ
eukprot:TRINITY_DN3119_c0_g1_i2.p1 TRINITY_DN3119_c0_g1~~TRINITY_DN3119_c0_g1_i2.p1  ORF type:complete len:127 (+),score=53.09 TRINITY_DN3119_c0_g1_i2:82-462(+)